MGGNRGMRRAATRALWAGGVAVLILLSCGEPLEPREAGWVTVARFPLKGDSGVNSIYTRGGTIWAAVYEETDPGQVTRAKIVTYDEGEFAVEYESPPEYEYAELADIAFDRTGDRGWAVGIKGEENNPYAPLLLAYDPRAEEWKERNVEGFGEVAFCAALPISNDGVWVLVDDHYLPGDRDGLLTKYSAGRFNVYENLGPVTAIYPYTRYSPQTLYAVSYAQNGYAPGELPKVYISANRGASWAQETIPADVVRGRVISRAFAGAGYGPDAYILAECGNNAWAVIRRSGGPGAGEYELAFLGHGGPYFNTLNGIAFRDPHSPPRGISVDGVAVGRETSVLFDEGNVYLEKLPYALDLTRVVLYGGSGFFAIGKNEAFGGWELLYHP
jgi:hypothetical protein